MLIDRSRLWELFFLNTGMRSADMQKSRPTCRNGCPRCKNFVADVCGWLSEMPKLCGRCLRLAVRDAKTLRPMFAAGCPRCKKLCGRCLRVDVRDAKNSAADVYGWLSEMQKLRTLLPMFAVGCPRCKKTCGRCWRSAA